jgi:dihydroorotate dehydrogenase
MYRLLRPLLFALPPEESHALGLLALGMLEALPSVRQAIGAALAPSPSLVTKHLGLTFPSPVGLAAGFDKNAAVPRALAALGFGFLELGTVTAEAQEPNPPPNLFRLPDDRALVNRLGFPNDGARTVAARFARDVGRGGAGVPVGFSIGKSRAVPIDPVGAVVDDYLASFRAVRAVSDFVAVNVSSPNTKGLRALQGAELARTLLAALAKENAAGDRVPMLLKISPDITDEDLVPLLDVVRETGLDGLIATNTTTARAGLRSRPSVVDAIGAGGLSGPPLRRRVLEVLPLARERLGPAATLIAVGGVAGAADVRRYLEAGADLVQLYTSFVYEGPTLAARIARDLADG